MDTVPIDVCHRVLATRKCCDISYGWIANYYESWASCSCARLCFAAQKWSQSVTKHLFISFHIGPENGKCRYFFRPESGALEYLSMDELMKFPEFANVRLSKIFIWENKSNLVNNDVVDIEKLLKFVSLIANEPALVLHGNRDEFYNFPNGKELLKWLAERWFSHIQAPIFSSIELRIVEKQFSRWKPTLIEMETSEEDDEFWENRLISGV